MGFLKYVKTALYSQYFLRYEMHLGRDDTNVFFDVHIMYILLAEDLVKNRKGESLNVIFSGRKRNLVSHIVLIDDLV